MVLDNCEHLLGGVATFVERLLTELPSHHRARDEPGAADGPARVRLPGARALARVRRASRATPGSCSSSAPRWPAGRRRTRATGDRIARICEELDGIALSIELAAARMATLGMDGLEAGLSDQLVLLAGGARLDERHRSARAALDWSFGLLDETDQVVLRRASVFATPFTSAAAAAVTGTAPLVPGQVASSLARLSDHNLLVAIRRSGRHPLSDAGDDQAVRHRAHRGGRRARRRTRSSSSLVPRDRSPTGRRRAVGGRVRRDGRRPEGRPWAGPRPDPSTGTTPTTSPNSSPDSPTCGGCRASPRSGTSKRRRWRPILPGPPRRCTSPRAWPGAGTWATTRCGSFATRPRRHAGPETPAGLPSSSCARLSWSRTRRASCPSWRRPARSSPCSRRLACWRQVTSTSKRPCSPSRRRWTSSTRCTRTWPSAPPSWPIGSETSAWRAMRSTS